MAGVEVVSLVLGGFPLLISAAEHYRDGFEPLKKWKRFRRDFIKFIDLVDIERELFNQVLKRLLLSAGVLHFELDFFMDPEYEGWNDQKLKLSLERRLGSSLPAYLSIISTMNGLLLELQALLSLKNGKVDWVSNGAERWDYQLKRFRLSFSDKPTSILESFETHNRKLRELLDSKDEVDGAMIVSERSSYQTSFEEMRLYANSLYEAVYKAWKCNYEHPHQTAFRLSQSEKSTWQSTFEISFIIRKEAPECLYVNRDVIIYIQRDGRTQSSSEGHSRSAEPLRGPFLQTLREDFTLQSSGSVVESSTLPMPSTLKSQYSASPVSSSFTGLFSRRSSSISTPSQSIFSSTGKVDDSATNVSSSSTTIRERTDPVKHIRRWSSFRRMTKNKPNQLYLSPNTTIERSHPLSAPLEPTSEFSHSTCIQIDDLCTCLCDQQSSSGCIGHLTGSKNPTS
ncbi:hypothetical protein BJ875DRAFT_812 [Amylocarpus encephaloides]|uniref:Prion-inhibition and propagation HeLo domain-containing protein n=1 Tax=Amylocarpus encephaloides TaxID=45428 RepID=A0A9P7YUL7_9HELO|nr:hypothetical protein BJ875DRAFT_812 [Amylocarpus encephaloides]